MTKAAARLAALVLALTAPAAAAQTCLDRTDLGRALAARPDLTWDALRAACAADIDRAVAADPVGFAWFANAGNGFAGTPLVLQLLLPRLAPDIWGPPEAAFARFGLFPDPTPGRILPRGLGVTGTLGRPRDAAGRLTGEIDHTRTDLLVVTLACGSCHSGQVETPQGTQVIEGAPNTQFDVRAWRAAFGATAARHFTPDLIGTAEAPGATARRLVELLDAAPPGTFARGLPGLGEADVARVDATQRAVFKAKLIPILQGFAATVAARADAVALQTRPGGPYGQPTSPGLAGHSAGQSDGSGDLMADLIAFAHARAGGTREALLAGAHPDLPRFATVTDAASVWRGADRSVGQWDGSVLDPFWRNIAAQLPIVGDPAKVDLENTWIVAEFLQSLPPPPYPFAVDLRAAARGQALFAEHCADCHRPRNARRYWELHTDFNRAAVLNPAGAARFVAAFQAACHDPAFTYTTRVGITRRPCLAPPVEILNDTSDAGAQGYAAGPLDGIWARAPYLHNGAVPTLEHLLTPATRPARFLRGVLDFDTTRVGWFWDADMVAGFAGQTPPPGLHDTARDGLSNRGHDRDVTLGGRTYRLDWSADPGARADLIEYLKTR